jgi:hypothetical protein
MVVRTWFPRGIILALAVLVASVAPAGFCLAAMQYIGVSLADADFGDSHLPGTYGQNAGDVNRSPSDANYKCREHGRFGG